MNPVPRSLSNNRAPSHPPILHRVPVRSPPALPASASASTSTVTLSSHSTQQKQTSSMAPKTKDAGKADKSKSAAGAKGKGKAKDDENSGSGKLKSAQSINVRHILVSAAQHARFVPPSSLNSLT